METVIIPAHNEAGVICSSLDSLYRQPGVDRLIVACNGCTDRTVNIVHEYSDFICLEMETASKINALNKAEKHITGWPVFYIDADTCLSNGAIETICKVMESGKLLLAAPEPVIATSHSFWWVRQYYRTWLSLPYIKDGVVATCSYVSSEQGRQRFGPFPSVINDDGYVRCQFGPDECGNVPGAQVFISAPKDLKSLIRIKTRARLGNMQLAAENLCPKTVRKPYAKILLQKLLSRDSISVVAYILIAVLIRIRAQWKFTDLAAYQWESDRSSRRKDIA